MKVTFLRQLQVEHTNDDKWTLLDEYEAAIEVDGKVFYIKIPPNFITDFCSVPRMPFVYLLLSGLGHHAGLIHDALYSDLDEIIVREISEVENMQFTREWADKVFLYALKACGINILYRHAMYYSVRFFGKKYFKRNHGK